MPHLWYLHDIIFNLKNTIFLTIVLFHTTVTVAYLCTCIYLRFLRFPECLFATIYNYYVIHRN